MIFGHCVGFEGVATADDFHDYITRCQVETTMPFNDYWADGLKFRSAQSADWALEWLRLARRAAPGTVAGGSVARRRFVAAFGCTAARDGRGNGRGLGRDRHLRC